MPQLDKYIYFNQVIGLIVIFTMIYVYLRRRGIPIIGNLVQYRITRYNIYHLTNIYMQIAAIDRHIIWRGTGRFFVGEFVKTFDTALTLLNLDFNKQLTLLKNKLVKKIKRKKNKNKTFKYKMTLENFRLNKINKKFN